MLKAGLNSPPIAAADPSPHRPMNETSPDLDSCASEPIRVPGAIQPHGRLLGARAPTADELLAYSANWRGAADGAQACAAALADTLPRAGGRRSPAAVGTLPLDGGTLDVSAHRQRRAPASSSSSRPAPTHGMQAPIYALARALPAAAAAGRLGRPTCANWRRAR